MTIASIDYGSGNLRSAAKALERASEGLGMQVQVTAAPQALLSASHIVLPGVGAFADCMHGLKAVDGLYDALHEAVRVKKKPFLGICVGMQMLFERGLENGDHAGLGWLKGAVKAIIPENAGVKIPHMGWNELDIRQPHPLLENIAQKEHVYFVHSYKAEPADISTVLASVEYSGTIPAVVAHDNLMGTQFHPEKSQATGLKLLRNFLKIG